MGREEGGGERDLIPALVTFFACLGFGVELGILIGIAVDISFLLYFNARPRVLVETLVSPGGSEYVLVTPSSGLLFPAVDFVREAVAAASLEGGPHHTKDLPVVVNCRHVQRVDFTAAQGIHAIVHDFVKRGRQVLFFQVCQHVVKTLSSAGNTRLVFVATEQELTVVLKALITPRPHASIPLISTDERMSPRIGMWRDLLRCQPGTSVVLVGGDTGDAGLTEEHLTEADGSLSDCSNGFTECGSRCMAVGSPYKEESCNDWIKMGNMERVRLLTTPDVTTSGKAEIALLEEGQRPWERSGTSWRTYQFAP
uniref:STAS domain-containing protein n=1 Tax=Timema monikensis TaxID=170555 RepID=A0A7R9HJP1_9NEOP|nr:unnamed protein product [Timema monikensis]